MDDLALNLSLPARQNHLLFATGTRTYILAANFVLSVAIPPVMKYCVVEADLMCIILIRRSIRAILPHRLFFLVAGQLKEFASKSPHGSMADRVPE